VPPDSDRPFGLDPSRTYDVDRGGEAREAAMPPPEWLSVRHRLILGLFALGALVVGALAGLTVAAFASGARGAAAVFALLTLASSPLLIVGPLQDRWRHRARRIRR
jgi:predicted lipid-binding transport protein (Tim44 family)